MLSGSGKSGMCSFTQLACRAHASCHRDVSQLLGCADRLANEKVECPHSLGTLTHSMHELSAPDPQLGWNRTG